MPSRVGQAEFNEERNSIIHLNSIPDEFGDSTMHQEDAQIAAGHPE